MNKKLFLLPFLTISLLVGCNNNSNSTPADSSNSEPAAKKIWELDEVEGESTIQQVKEGTAGQYYKVRGTVAANTGSTLAIYRKGQFLYCYNFKADATDKLKAHPLGSYVEIYAQSSAYSGSVQLTAYDVGTEKSTDKYDLAASLTVLENEGEPIEPVTVTTAAELANAPAAGKLMKFDFVPKKDFTFAADATDNQDLEGYIGETLFTLRLEKYLDADAKTALLAANPAQFAIGAKYSVVALGAATSSGSVRGIICEGSSWVKTDDAHFAEPTAVVVAPADGSTTVEVEIGKTTLLDFLVQPNNAKQVVTWSSENTAIATVEAVGDQGKVTGVAAGKVKIIATSVDKNTVKGEFEVTVIKSAAAPITETVKLDFSARTETGTYIDSIVKEGTTKYTVLEVIQAAANKPAHITDATSKTIASGNGSGGAYPNSSGFLKGGSSSANGTLTLTFDGLVNKVVIKAHDWNKKTDAYPTNSNKVAVNDGEGVFAPYNETGTGEDMTFNLAVASDTIKIETQKRVFIWTIEYSYVPATLA